MKLWPIYVAIFLITLSIVGCSTAAAPTPIDVEMLSPEQQEIVIEAQRFLSSSRTEFQSPPQIILLEKTTRSKALKRMASSEEIVNVTHNSGKNQVWLVLFEGEMRVIPPNPLHTWTPGPFTHQCVYVLIDPETHLNGLRGTRCPGR